MCIRVICLLSLLCLGVSIQADETLPTTRLSPKVKVTDRDWSFFRDTPCARLQNVVVHSAGEKLLLERRRKQCLEKYRAFSPKSGVC